MAIPEFPPDCGKRPAACYIHQVAADDPERVCISIPLTLEPRDGFKDITFKQLDKAIDVASTWIETQFGIGQNFECLPYIGPQDLRYVLLMIASVNTGHKLFVPSPRNSLEAHVKLLHDYQCDSFLVAEESQVAQKIVNGIQSQIKLQVVRVPRLEYFLDPANHARHYEYNKSFDEAKLDPFAAMHTSGTTGLPKPIVVRQGVIASLDACQRIASLCGSRPFVDYWKGMRCFLPFPLFHAAGLGYFISSLFYNSIVVLPPPVPLTAELANEIHVHGNVQASQLPPAILVEISKVPEHLDNLSRLSYMCTGGGPLPKSIGDLISSRTHLFVGFGSTEMGPFPSGIPSREDWDYFDFSAAFGVDMRLFTDDLYELVVVREPAVEAYQGVFYTFPELSEYKTNDLFSKHPTKDGLWRHQGRSDDIIVYSTGEKFNPISMEDKLCSDPNIKSAIVYGMGKFQSALLIEPHNQNKSKAVLLDEIWPSIHKANAVCPSHARVEKNFIVFTNPDKALPRAGKGTVQRKLALHLYQTELDSLYQDAIDGSSSKEKPSLNTADNLLSIIQSCVANLEGFQSVSSSDNFFEMGMDSLGVISLTRALNSSLKARNPNCKPVFQFMIYENPTIDSLALALGQSCTADDRNHEAMQRQYDKYAIDLPIVARPQTPKTGETTFLLTGSTGSLGSYILESLLSTNQTCKVYCLNRGSDSKERQHKSNLSKGLSTNFDRVEFLSMGSGTEEQWLGLELPQYKRLLREVTHVIHNAWHVDFNVSLDHLGPIHIRRVRQLIDFSAHSKYGCSIHFISTIGSVGNWDVATSATSDSRVPEVVFDDWSLPQGVGYAQAKFVAERLLAAACRDADIPVAIYRVGQIAGPTTSKGKWNESEWFPLILRSSMYLKVLPSTLGPVEAVDWIPVDVFGYVIQELVVGSRISNIEAVEDAKLEPTVYHLINPKRTTYSESILPCLTSRFGLPTVSFEEWVNLLKDSAADVQAADIERNPAVKLLGLFESLVDMEKNGRSQVWLDTTKAVEDSKLLKETDVVSGVLMDNWLRQWGLVESDQTQ
ncbi:hypothetical protein ACMFMG_007227 [Clarireedia jacksonii]